MFKQSPHLKLDSNHEYSRSDDDKYILHGTSHILQQTGISPDFSAVNQQLLKHATDRGKRVHLAIELQNKGELDMSSLNEEDGAYFHGWQKFQATHGFTSILQEQMFLVDIDGKQGNAGTIDDIAIVNTGEYHFGNEKVVIDKPTIAIIDYKTGSSISKSALFQVGGSYANGYFNGLNGKNLEEPLVDLVEKKSGFKAEQVLVFILHIKKHDFKLIAVDHEKYIPKWSLILQKYLDPDSDINLDMLVSDQVYMSEHMAKRLLMRKRLENKTLNIKDKITRRAEDSLNIDGVFTSGLGFADGQKVIFNRTPDSIKEVIDWEMFSIKILKPDLAKVLEDIKEMPDDTQITMNELSKMAGIDVDKVFTKKEIMDRFNECKSLKERSGSYTLSIKKATDTDLKKYEEYLAEKDAPVETEQAPVEDKLFLRMDHPAGRNKEQEMLSRQAFKILVDQYKDEWEQRDYIYCPKSDRLKKLFSELKHSDGIVYLKSFVEYHMKAEHGSEKPKDTVETDPETQAKADAFVEKHCQRKIVPIEINTPDWLKIGSKVKFRKESRIATVTSELKLTNESENQYGVKLDEDEEYTPLYLLIQHKDDELKPEKKVETEAVLETKMPAVQKQLIGVVRDKLEEFGYTEEEACLVAQRLFKTPDKFLDTMSEDVLLRLAAYMHTHRKNLVPKKDDSVQLVEKEVEIKPVEKKQPEEKKQSIPEQCGLF